MPDIAMAKRKAKPSRRASATNEFAFWNLIEAARRAGDFIATLTASLEGQPAEDIVGFQCIFERKLADAYTFPLLAANFIIQSYVSDDVFEDFRAWLVKQGRKRFEAALSDPESICDWLERKEVKGMDGESMLFVAQNAYEAYGDEEEFSARIKYPRRPELKQEWPDSKAGFEKRWPRLVGKFWNQQRIKKLHGG